MSEFDAKAREWDKEKANIDRTQAIAAKLKDVVPLSSSMNVMEYGAGTGLLSFALKDDVGSILMLDSSQEMVRVSQEKIEASKATNMKAMYYDLEKDNLQQQFNLIFHQLVLHHVKDVNTLLKKLYNMLLPGGYLAMADIYTEDGSFHGPGADVHLGFDPEKLSNELQQIGFKNIQHLHCYTLQKTTYTGEIKDFPIFLLVARK